jgi:hypothetical protein
MYGTRFCVIDTAHDAAEKQIHGLFCELYTSRLYLPLFLAK